MKNIFTGMSSPDKKCTSNMDVVASPPVEAAMEAGRNNEAVSIIIDRCLSKIFLAMKLTVPFVLVACLQVSAHVVDAQRITYAKKNVSLEKVFNAIRKQTGYEFLYNTTMLGWAKKEDLKFSDTPLKVALDGLFKNQPLTYTIVGKTIVVKRKKEELSVPASGEILFKEVQGTVVDSTTGEPLAGVTIKVKGGAIGTVTDANGEFSLNVSEGATLGISFLGYETQEIHVNEKSSYHILLAPSSSGLNEVVVLGFGQTQKKIAQTGSIASIGTKELLQSPAANLTNALAGRLPGLISVQRSGEPGANAATLYIRGLSTLNSNEPLIVIDGIQKDYSELSLLDPHAVESVTILKDASATALYGVKGANGVIIIKTRRGREGKPKIEITIQKAVQQPIRLPDFANSYDYARLRNVAYFNDNPGGTTPPFSKEAIELYRNQTEPYRYPNTDWINSFIKENSNLTRANFDISGGGKQAKYFVNVGYTGQDGIYKLHKVSDDYDPRLKYSRYNFRSNIDIAFDKNFSMSMNLFGAIENKNGPRKSTDEIFNLLMWPPPVAAVMYPVDGGTYALSGVFEGGNIIGSTQQEGYVQSFNSSLSGKLSATEKLDFITKGLSINGSFSFDGNYFNDISRARGSRFAFYQGGDLLEDSSYKFQGEEINPIEPPSSSTHQSRSTWLQFSVNYQRGFGKEREHLVSGLLLANRQQQVISGEIPYVSQGLVGRFTYSYRNKYFAEFDAGLNGTDNFAPEHRYGFFPAYSAAWIISQEPFLKESRAIGLLKLRGSYGIVGSDKLPGRRWMYISEFVNADGYSFGDPLNFINGMEEGPMSNPEITWETSQKANVGLDLDMFGGLIGLTLDVFQQKRNNILITRQTIPALIGRSGSDLPPANIGRTINKGFELVLQHQNRLGKDFVYSVRVNLTHARNKILFMDEPKREYSYLSRTGQRIGQLFGLTAIGLFHDQDEIDKSPKQFGTLIPGDIKYKDLNGDGVIDADDEGPIGKSETPETMYGIAGTFRWKNWDLSFLVQGAGGFNVMRTGRSAWPFYNQGKILVSSMNGLWTPETANTAIYPTVHFNSNANDFRESTLYLRNAGYTRLKNAELGYTFKDVLAKAGSKGIPVIRIYANGQNLFTWDKVGDDYDPESPSGEGTVYPILRVINLGATISF